jgi:hypothetical protein
MRNLFLAIIFALLVSCIGGKSKPVQFYTLDAKGSSDFALYVREVSAGGNIHDRISLKSGSRIELLEFDRWEESPRRLVEVGLKNYFSLGEGDLRSEINDFVFDLKSNEARISMDFVHLGEGNEPNYFRVRSSEKFTSTDPALLSEAMSKALTKLFVKLDHKLKSPK